MTTKRDPASLWRTIQEQQLDDELDDILEMSDADLDAYITKNGGDAARIRAAGAAHVKELEADAKRLPWHGDMESKLASFRALADAHKADRARTKLTRAELETRLAAARKNPAFSAPVQTLFQKKTEEASTDEELQALLDEIELLAKLEDE